MKLSELSYREYLASEFLPASVCQGEIDPEPAIHRAFSYADAFLLAAGKQYDAEAHAEALASAAETKFEVLQSIHLNMGENFVTRAALTQIWELLGVDNQTAAMTKLREVFNDRA